MNVYDVETFNKNGKVIAFCICFIIENVSYSIYYKEKTNIFLESFKLASEKSSNEKLLFYVHNINFDGFLILETLFSSNIVFNFVKRGLNIYNITFLYLGTLFEFRCSYKMLPLSLLKLGELVGIQKKIYPYSFVNEKRLFYIGSVPDEIYFKNKEEWAIFNKEHPIFDLKKVTIDYCLQDVIILSKVLKEVVLFMHKLGDDCLKIFKKSLTIPSFSYKIFFKKYNTFGIDSSLKLEYKNYIKPSYFGGRCEVFGNPKPGELVHHFDFSGMYAQCMLENFPYGEIKLEIEPKAIIRPGFYHINYLSNN
jgi:hypothetical protein